MVRRREISGGGFVVLRSFLERLRVGANHAHRRPKLMRDIGDKVSPNGFEMLDLGDVVEHHDHTTPHALLSCTQQHNEVSLCSAQVHFVLGDSRG